MPPAEINAPQDPRAALLRLARRLKRERDQGRNELADALAQLEAFEALLAGAFPPVTENP